MTNPGISQKKTSAVGAAKTNKPKSSLVKVVVVDDIGKWLSPSAKKEFFIDQDAAFPKIDFEIDTIEPAPYTWSWNISWDAKKRTRENGSRGNKLKTFTAKGSFTSDHKKWTANLGQLVLGGKLTVEITTGTEKFKRHVIVKAKNPDEQQVKDFLSKIENVKGFEKIIDKESNFKNFINADGEPVLSFDGGYGLTQMTNPAPTYHQVWSWKENVKAGCGLYQTKQKEAKGYLGKENRTYTDDQLKLETWSRWNGGVYHVWNEKKKDWIRNDDLLCDSATGNIGWKMTNTDNNGQTEAELHKRDKEEYKDPPKTKKWTYTGVCYADHLNHE